MSASSEEEMEDFYSDLEDANKKCGNQDIVIVMHSRIKLVTGKKRGNNTTTCIEDKNGDIITEKDEILSR